MGGKIKYRTLIESEEFSEQCRAFGGTYRIEQALAAVTWVLSARPEAYPVISGLKTTRLVTTDRFTDSEGTIPRLRVYFKVLNEDEVELLWIEEDLERRGYRGI